MCKNLQFRGLGLKPELYINTKDHMCMCIYIYIYIYVCVCVHGYRATYIGGMAGVRFMFFGLSEPCPCTSPVQFWPGLVLFMLFRSWGSVKV